MIGQVSISTLNEFKLIFTTVSRIHRSSCILLFHTPHGRLNRSMMNRCEKVKGLWYHRTPLGQYVIGVAPKGGREGRERQGSRETGRETGRKTGRETGRETGRVVGIERGREREAEREAVGDAGSVARDSPS